MRKTLCKHGNTYALVIDKPILDLLGATPETPFDIVTNGRSLVLSPVRSEKEEARFVSALDSVVEQYGEVFKRLAE